MTATRTTSRCHDCDQPVLWAVQQGTWERIALDPEPDPAGELAIVARQPDGTPIVEPDDSANLGATLPIFDTPTRDRTRHRNHKNTCVPF